MRHEVVKNVAEGEITMNLIILLAGAVLLACALPPAVRAGSLTTEVIGMFPPGGIVWHRNAQTDRTAENISR
jgi:hypothetical protein